MPRARVATPTSVYQVLVTLQEIEPAIWRRLLLPSDMRLGKLHRVLQCVMDWEDYHLHQFIAGATHYGVPDPEWEDELPTVDERTIPLRRVLRTPGDVLVYEYDFGDSWRHDILLEQILPTGPDRSYPLCLAGAGARPPEDVGGVGGYQEFLLAIDDPEHEEHEAMLTWVGGVFDPDGFDVTMVNRRLRRLRSQAHADIWDAIARPAICTFTCTAAERSSAGTPQAVAAAGVGPRIAGIARCQVCWGVPNGNAASLNHRSPRCSYRLTSAALARIGRWLP